MKHSKTPKCIFCNKFLKKIKKFKFCCFNPRCQVSADLLKRCSRMNIQDDIIGFVFKIQEEIYQIAYSFDKEKKCSIWRLSDKYSYNSHISKNIIYRPKQNIIVDIIWEHIQDIDSKFFNFYDSKALTNQLKIILALL